MLRSYVESSLVPDEHVAYAAKLHWIIYVPHIILMFLVVGLFTIFIPIVRQLTTEMVITNKRIIIKIGWISRKTLEMNLSKIETVAVDQNILGRIFGVRNHDHYWNGRYPGGVRTRG